MMKTLKSIQEKGVKQVTRSYLANNGMFVNFAGEWNNWDTDEREAWRYFKCIAFISVLSNFFAVFYLGKFDSWATYLAFLYTTLSASFNLVAHIAGPKNVDDSLRTLHDTVTKDDNLFTSTRCHLGSSRKIGEVDALARMEDCVCWQRIQLIKWGETRENPIPFEFLKGE